MVKSCRNGMRRKHFYILIASIWATLILRAYFMGDFIADSGMPNDCRQHWYGNSPFECDLDFRIAELLNSIFWGIFSSAILYSLIDIEDDDEEE